MEKKVSFKKPKYFKRISSAFFDLFVAAVLSFLVSFIFTPIMEKAFDYKSNNQRGNEIVCETKLYVYTDDGNSIVKTNSIQTFDSNLSYFYKECINKLDEYNNKKKENTSLFELDPVSNNYVEKPHDLSNGELNGLYLAFYDDVLDYTLETYFNDYINQNEEYVKICNKVRVMQFLEVMLSAFTGFAIVYILFPLIHKEGKTVGKIVFKLKVISIAGINTKPSKLQILFRGLVTVIFEYLLTLSTVSLVGFPIPITLVVSMVMILLTKYHQSFHDICCSTIIVDDYIGNEPLDEGEKYVITYTNL